MRYLPHTAQEIHDMLQAIGVSKVDELFSSIDTPARLNRLLDLPPPLSEMELRNCLREISRKNAHGEDWAIFLGAGSYSHYIPSAVSQLLSRGEFLTAYTPYQPEVSQGTLQAIFEYQTMVCEILGMEVANASHYDGSTSMAEAALMALSITKRTKVLVARNIHPEYREVLKTYLQNEDAVIEEIPFDASGAVDRKALSSKIDHQTACVIAGTPNFFGIIEDLTDIATKIHEAGGLLVTVTQEPLALGLFKSPGEMDADIVVAEGQSFGNTMSFGGPYLGMFATREKFVRAMPGRLVGQTVDAEGKRGFVLTLATREQHIRRERASSNICTNVALCALAATITLALWGQQGFEQLARMNYDGALRLREQLGQIKGLRPRFSGTHFNEFVIETSQPAESILKELQRKNIIGGVALGRWYPELSHSILITVTEMNTVEQINHLIAALRDAA